MASTIAAPLLNKSAIITGGSRGIGAAIALEFVRLGISRLAITYGTGADAAKGVVDKIQSKYPNVRCTTIQADLLSPNFGKRIVDATISDLGLKTVDIVVNNAALSGSSVQEPFEQMKQDSFEKTMLANAWAPIQLIQAVLPVMSHGEGRIINISSTSSKRPNMDPIMAYGMSKAALDSITRSLAARFAAERGITINSVSPGPTQTEMMQRAMESNEKLAESLAAGATAAKRVGTPEDVAEIVGFLAGPGARWINGNQIPANGGRVLDLQS